MEELSPSNRGHLANEIALHWESICENCNVDPSSVKRRVVTGSPVIEYARQFVDAVCDCNMLISDFVAALRRSGCNSIASFAYLATSGNTRTNVESVASASPMTVTPTSLPLTGRYDRSSGTGFGSGGNQRSGSSGVPSALMALDEEETILTLHDIVFRANHKICTKITAALDDCWKDVLGAPQADPKVAAAFVHILTEVEQEQRRADDAEFNAPHCMLEKLCVSKRFATMPVTQFVNSVLAPVNARLQRVARDIVRELERADDKKLAAIESKTAELINWREMIKSLRLQLKDGVTEDIFIARLKDLGAESAEHIEHADVDDLVQCGLKKISANIVKKHFEAKKKSVPRAPHAPVSRLSRDEEDDEEDE